MGIIVNLSMQNYHLKFEMIIDNFGSFVKLRSGIMTILSRRYSLTSFPQSVSGNPEKEKTGFRVKHGMTKKERTFVLNVNR
jgi:hypothetical protein